MPVAEVVRNGFVEGVHFGSVVGLNADGSVAFSVGDVDRPVHPRSTNKLFQSAAMRELGLALQGEQLSLSAASHWGESFHVAGVRAILTSAGLDESALQNTASLPTDPDAQRAAIRADTEPSPVLHGCSGKHASMLATCALQGWPVESYLDPAHPLQQQLRGWFEVFVGAPIAHQAVDGCGSPAWAVSLASLADGYRRAVLAPETSAISAVASAMREHPQYVGGTASEVTGIMRAVPGALCKDGAESVYAAALPDGRAVALKISDGGFRAGQVVLVAALRALITTDDPSSVDAAGLARLGTIPVLGHGEVVGEIRPLPLRENDAFSPLH